MSKLKGSSESTKAVGGFSSVSIDTTVASGVVYVKACERLASLKAELKAAEAVKWNYEVEGLGYDIYPEYLEASKIVGKLRAEVTMATKDSSNAKAKYDADIASKATEVVTEETPQNKNIKGDTKMSKNKTNTTISKGGEEMNQDANLIAMFKAVNSNNVTKGVVVETQDVEVQVETKQNINTKGDVDMNNNIVAELKAVNSNKGVLKKDVAIPNQEVKKEEVEVVVPKEEVVNDAAEVVAVEVAEYVETVNGFATDLEILKVARNKMAKRDNNVSIINETVDMNVLAKTISLDKKLKGTDIKINKLVIDAVNNVKAIDKKVNKHKQNNDTNVRSFAFVNAASKKADKLLQVVEKAYSVESMLTDMPYAVFKMVSTDSFPASYLTGCKRIEEAQGKSFCSSFDDQTRKAANPRKFENGRVLVDTVVSLNATNSSCQQHLVGLCYYEVVCEGNVLIVGLKSDADVDGQISKIPYFENKEFNVVRAGFRLPPTTSGVKGNKFFLNLSHDVVGYNTSKLASKNAQLNAGMVIGSPILKLNDDGARVIDTIASVNGMRFGMNLAKAANVSVPGSISDKIVTRLSLMNNTAMPVYTFDFDKVGMLVTKDGLSYGDGSGKFDEKSLAILANSLPTNNGDGSMFIRESLASEYGISGQIRISVLGAKALVIVVPDKQFDAMVATCNNGDKRMFIGNKANVGMIVDGDCYKNEILKLVIKKAEITADALAALIETELRKEDVTIYIQNGAKAYPGAKESVQTGQKLEVEELSIYRRLAHNAVNAVTPLGKDGEFHLSALPLSQHGIDVVYKTATANAKFTELNSLVTSIGFKASGFYAKIMVDAVSVLTGGAIDYILGSFNMSKKLKALVLDSDLLSDDAKAEAMKQDIVVTEKFNAQAAMAVQAGINTLIKTVEYKNASAADKRAMKEYVQLYVGTKFPTQGKKESSVDKMLTFEQLRDKIKFVVVEAVKNGKISDAEANELIDTLFNFYAVCNATITFIPASELYKMHKAGSDCDGDAEQQKQEKYSLALTAAKIAGATLVPDLRNADGDDFLSGYTEAELIAKVRNIADVRDAAVYVTALQNADTNVIIKNLYKARNVLKDVRFEDLFNAGSDNGTLIGIMSDLALACTGVNVGSITNDGNCLTPSIEYFLNADGSINKKELVKIYAGIGTAENKAKYVRVHSGKRIVELVEFGTKRHKVTVDSLSISLVNQRISKIDLDTVTKEELKDMLFDLDLVKRAMQESGIDIDKKALAAYFLIELNDNGDVVYDVAGRPTIVEVITMNHFLNEGVVLKASVNKSTASTQDNLVADTQKFLIRKYKSDSAKNGSKLLRAVKGKNEVKAVEARNAMVTELESSITSVFENQYGDRVDARCKSFVTRQKKALGFDNMSDEEVAVAIEKAKVSGEWKEFYVLNEQGSDAQDSTRKIMYRAVAEANVEAMENGFRGNANNVVCNEFLQNYDVTNLSHVLNTLTDNQAKSLNAILSLSMGTDVKTFFGWREDTAKDGERDMVQIEKNKEATMKADNFLFGIVKGIFEDSRTEGIDALYYDGLAMVKHAFDGASKNNTFTSTQARLLQAFSVLGVGAYAPVQDANFARVSSEEDKEFFLKNNLVESSKYIEASTKYDFTTPKQFVMVSLTQKGKDALKKKVTKAEADAGLTYADKFEQVTLSSSLFKSTFTTDEKSKEFDANGFFRLSSSFDGSEELDLTKLNEDGILSKVVVKDTIIFVIENK